MSIAQVILQEIEPYLTQSSTVWVGYSGGVDSTVLLHVLATLPERPFTLRALHINHQLSAQADNWQSHCEKFSRALEVAFVSRKVKVDLDSESPENAARIARYREFADIVRAGDFLLCAHHQDDQAETLLFRMLRGAGLRGLTGIPAVRVLKEEGKAEHGTLLRPMLSLSRHQLEDYARQHALTWIEDESNQDTAFDRNYLRQTVMPLLQKRWPGFAARMQQASIWLSEADSLLSEYARQDLAHCDLRQEKLGQSLALSAFMQFSRERQKHVVREWVLARGYSAPDNKHLGELHSLLNSAPDAEPSLAWGLCELRRFRGRLYLIPRLSKVDPNWTVRWDGALPLQLPDGSVLEFEREHKTAASDQVCFHVGFRQGGERCKPITRGHSQTLKKLLQEYALEPWLRDRVPLVYRQETLSEKAAGGEKVNEKTLLAVGDLFVCGEGRAEQAVSFELSWIYP